MTNKNNSSLQNSKETKDDEFYTQYSDIESEIENYVEYHDRTNPAPTKSLFEDATIFLPADNGKHSNFTKYFTDNFKRLKLKRLISTCYSKGGYGTITTRGEFGSRTELLFGDGDFRSPELKKFRDKADFIITNPPFSLFREFLQWVGDKRFLIVGNINAITYKDTFPLIQDNKIWLGVNNRLSFMRPSGEVIKMGFTCWYTNLEHDNRHEPLELLTEAENRSIKNDQ